MPESNQESELVPEANSGQKSGPEVEPRPEGAENQSSPHKIKLSHEQQNNSSDIEQQTTGNISEKLYNYITGESFKITEHRFAGPMFTEIQGSVLSVIEETVKLLEDEQKIKDPQQRTEVSKAVSQVLSKLYQYIIELGDEISKRYPDIDDHSFRLSVFHKFLNQYEGNPLKSNN